MKAQIMLTRRGFLFRKPETKSHQHKLESTSPCGAAVHERLRLEMAASLHGKNATPDELAAMHRANACPFCGVKLAD